MVILAVILVTIPIPLVARFKNRATNEKKDLLRLWEAGDFEQAFSMSKTALQAKPLDYFLLTINGFSAYQVGISRINSLDTLAYIDECIRSLRKALLLKNAAEDGRVYYVLGKAYSCKGTDYADLAVTCLEKARALSYQAADISEYLGLAYAAVGDYRGSVSAFSEALSPAGQGSEAPSDLLLLSIARSYMAMEEFDTARAYLLRCIEVSPDSQSALSARLLLAEALRNLGDIAGAENQYLAILNEAGANAEAHFQLGELYNQQGDATRARSEWRLAYRTDPAHAKARARLNM
jgi:tetratricopeptide (TPR) repeat protein